MEQMDDLTSVERLSRAIGQATRSAKFCVLGCLPVADPGIEVDGLGTIALPLKPTTVKKLVASCQVAPYGKGTQTLVNTKVRNTFELDPKQFRLSDAWNAAIADAMRHVADQLGLPADQLEAKLYKLLVYEKGGFFLPHRDSEKLDRMVASLIVVLPNPFEGGRLIVRHGAAKQTLTFDEAASGKAPCYAAFYADCEHEVQRVTSGVRLCLAYNLVLKPKRVKPSAAAKAAAPADVLAESIGSWVASQPAKPLVFALDHHYTERGLSLDLLKGVDRQLADLVVAAAEKTACIVHLAQVSRHLSQFADDGSFGRGYSHYDRASRRAIEIGETYEDDLSGTDWTDVRGTKQPLGNIAFDLSAIVSSVPIDDWKPTSEEFEGYTGNAGNTLDRWYHRSAIVVWHRDHHFDVVASSGATDSIPLFCSMAVKLTKTPRKRLKDARIDCIRFACAIIARWPHRRVGFGHSATEEKSPYDDLPAHLLALHDRHTIAMFLTKLGEQDQSLRLSSFIVAACREFGWNAFASELKRLISSRPDVRGRQEIPFRDVEWLSAFCCDETADSDKSALVHEFCALAVERFCEPRPPQPTYNSPHRRRETSVSETSLPLLLKALAASGRDEGLSRVIQFVQGSPDEFSLDDCEVPCLKSLIPWSQKQFGSVHPQLASWLVAVRQKLESATATRPAPPADWARPADVACKCEYCAQLKAFLADPANEVGRIPAREDIRQHLIGIIDRHQCDVTYILERKGSPYSLVLTKTKGSFERAVKRFEVNRRLLSALPIAE
jgi:2OG-Fe(II) oxygenase superfamily